MNKLAYKISFSFCLIVSVTLSVQLLAQNASGIQQKILFRDSLDFNQIKNGLNTKAKEFNPIPFKDGLLFVSNKQTIVNKYGFNKVYWVPKSLIGKNDSSTTNVNLNDDFTAPTSNDNNILYRYNKKKVRMANNAIENKFAEFIPEESFSIDDTASYIIYPQLSKRKIAGTYKWELWEANLEDGKLKNARKIEIIDSTADYLSPFLTNNGNRLYFSSNRTGGKGGFDIYSLEKMNGVWNTLPNVEAIINTEYDEKNPTVNGYDLFFSSNRPGGIGGFDLYRRSMQPGIKDESVFNLGYPINTESNNTSVVKFNNEFYTAQNNLGALDIAAIQYQPIFIPISGRLSYNSDATLLPNQSMIVYDNELNIAVDSIYTDANASYLFNAKPNRNYTFRVKNADNIEESFAITTTDKILPSITFATNLKGRSPIQIQDSIKKVWAAIEQKRQDSLAEVSLESKFIVYYGFDKSNLSTKERLVLDSLYNKLLKMPTTYLIIGAFTDCVGSFKYNYSLSVKRAKYVVNYLKKKGLPSNRFVSNGYSKNYTITPCLVNSNNKTQQNNRRAEIVLSSVGNTNWAKLEKERGKSYYAVYDSKKNITPVKLAINVNPIVKVKQEQKKDSAILLKTATVASISKVKVVKSINKPVLKIVEKQPKVEMKVKDSIIVKVNNVVKKDTIKVTIANSTLAKLNVKANVNPTPTPTLKPVALPVSKPVVSVSKPMVQVASPSTYVEDEISKAEILKALDSLATLKREQERIVEYLTKRINKKPIDVFVSSDSVTIEIYDNAIHDKDSVSIIFNNRIVVDKQELKVNKPIKFKLKVDKNKKFNEMIMVAENLGAEPPNTAVMFVTEKNGRKQQIMLSTDMLHNEVVYFIRIGKE
jgi:outer membrane protein OmpA-like peptidoglycan-associated protein